ncbi:MAG: sulfatase-like hydrolase/transferase [Bacteroidota bacterium]
MRLRNYILSGIIFYVAIAINVFGQHVRPNVLVIYTDDHRYSGIHALGNQAVSTPNMDALAHDGISFTKTYLMGSFSGATCVPSRAMLLTGRNLFQLEGAGNKIPVEHTTMGEAFQQAGYHTHIVGKWHQDHQSLARSFDSGAKLMGLGTYLVDHFRMPLWDWNDEGTYSRENSYLEFYDKAGQVSRRTLREDDQRGPIGTEQDGPHTSEIFADAAISFISKYDNPTPFFMYLAFHAPHDPRQAPQKYQDMYSAENIELSPSYLPQHPFDNGDMVLRDEALAPWPRTPKIAQQQLADYYAIISHLDAQIGRVIAALEKNGMYEKTIIVLAGDSGLAAGNHGLMGKQNIYDEDGIHVPFIIAGGAIEGPGRKINALSYIHDIFPTICDLTGVPIPSTVSGKSLLPVINSKKEQVRDHTYHAYQQFQRAYRKGDYKLIEYVRAKDSSRELGEITEGSKVTQLFNIAEDPWETQDLSFFPEHYQRVKSLSAEMKEKAIELGDSKDNTGMEYDFWDFF